MQKYVRALLICGGLLVLAIAAPDVSYATWPRSPFTNVPISCGPGDQVVCGVVPDGAGGMILVAKDTGSSGRIYAQRVAADGSLLWPSNGIDLGFSGYTFIAAVASDGAHGAIVAWQQDLVGVGSVVRAQRLSASGAVQWVSGGTVVCADGHVGSYVAISGDGEGGAVVSWSDGRNVSPIGMGGSADVYAQRLTGNGTALWGPSGVVVCATVMDDVPGAVVANADGSAVVLCSQFGGSRLQRLSAVGSSEWGAEGMPLGDGARVMPDPVMASDGNGGAVALYFGIRDGGMNLCAQRFAQNGLSVWGVVDVARGVNSTGSYDSGNLDVEADGLGGVFTTWSDTRNGNYGVFAQRLSSDGIAQWDVDGLFLSARSGILTWPRIALDGFGGAIVVWTSSDIYAQRISAHGEKLWSEPEVAICLDAHNQDTPCVLPDGLGGAILAWNDARAGNWDVYAQWIDGAGSTMRSEPTITAVRDIQGDQGGKVRIKWAASNLDHASIGMAMYGLWRQVEELSFDREALQRESPAAEAGPGVFRTTSDKLGVRYWEGVGTVLARGYSDYSFTTFTYQDSSATANPYSTFMVDFHAAQWTDYWDAAPDSGYSVDNLPPSLPANVWIDGGAVLRWDMAPETDFHHYRVYGSIHNDLDTSAVMLTQTTNTYFNVGAQSYPYLMVTATDIHGNESAAAVRAALSGVAVVSPALRLYPCQPNPFNPRTTIKYDLPEAGPVRLSVFDVAGRLVRALIDESVPQGGHEAVWDGRDSSGREVGSGSYLARLEFGGKVETVRMGLVR